MKRVALIGSTGSVGENTLRVIEAAAGRFEVVGLGAGGNWERLSGQIKRFQPLLCSVGSEGDAAATRALLGDRAPEVASGEEGLCRVASMPEADLGRHGGLTV